MKILKLIIGGILLLSNMAFAQININSATAEELEKLNGIGAVKAKAIVEYREKNGDFNNVEDLLKVDGIGKGILEKIKSEVVVEPANSATATPTTAATAESDDNNGATTDSAATTTPSASPSASVSPEKTAATKDTDKSEKQDKDEANKDKNSETSKK